MIIALIIWLLIGLSVYITSAVHDILKRQDVIVKWINEAITSKDIPRKQWPLLEPQRYRFFALYKGFVITLLLWPVVVNRKLNGL